MNRTLAILSTALAFESVLLGVAAGIAVRQSREADKYAKAFVYCGDLLSRNDIPMDDFDLVAMLTILEG